jgi:hypothetical protein
MSYTNLELKNKMLEISRGDRIYKLTAEIVGNCSTNVHNLYSMGKTPKGANFHVIRTSIDCLLDKEAEPDPRLLSIAA